MKHATRLIPALLCAFVLSACASLGVQAPKTFEDHIANAYSTLSGTRDVSTTLAKFGKIDAAELSAVMDQCDAIRESIEVARAVHGTNPAEGEQQIDKILAQLNRLNSYLERRKAGEAAPLPTANEVPRNELENRRRITRIDDHIERSDEAVRAGQVAASGGARGSRYQLD